LDLRILARAKNTDDPADDMSQENDHGQESYRNPRQSLDASLSFIKAGGLMNHKAAQD
jgi:hypothetical protein